MLTNDQVKQWAKYYAQLVGLGVWSGAQCWLYVMFGGGVAQAAQLADLRTISWKAYGWTLAGTVLANVVAKLFSVKIPDPAPPAPPST